MSIKEAIAQQKHSKFDHNQKGTELTKILESFHSFKNMTEKSRGVSETPVH